MLFFQDEAGKLAGGASAWHAEGLFWLGLAAVLVLALATVGIWTLVLRLSELRRGSERLRRLDEIQAALERLVADRDDLDLRRIEHVLIDVRDGSRRLEDALLRSLELSRGAAPAPASAEIVPYGARDGLGERVTNRLLALGYERVQIVTRAEKLLELAAHDGEVLVEARRGGVLHKGRILVRGGQLSDVEMNPAYSIFP